MKKKKRNKTEATLPLQGTKDPASFRRRDREYVAGFPLVPGRVNQCWDWNTLEDVKFN